MYTSFKCLGRAFFVLALFFFAFGAWADCTEGDFVDGVVIVETGLTSSQCSEKRGDVTTADCPDPTENNYTQPISINVSCINDALVGGKWLQRLQFQCHYGLYCSDCSLDSLQCLKNGGQWVDDSTDTECGKSCKYDCDSTWYHCETVFTENNVLRSEITEYNCDSIVGQRYILGTCEENNFCNGSSINGLDSCSYNNTITCRPSGQSGSLCTYVCNDGSFRSCNIAWVAGQPSEYQSCPQSMPSNCGGRSSSSSNDGSSSSYSSSSSEDGSSSSHSSSSSNGDDGDCPECEILQAIKDTLHNANLQRKVTQDYLLNISNDVPAIVTNTQSIAGSATVTASRINTSNGLLRGIDSTNKKISDKLDDLDLDGISVDSVIVHIDLPKDTVPFYYTMDLDSLPIWRDTISDVHRTIDSIKAEIDSINRDTTGIIGKYLPYLKKMSDKLADLTGDCNGVECVLRPAIDTLVTKMTESFGLDTVSPVEEQGAAQKITRLSDSTYIEGNWYCIQHPDDDLCVELDSMEIEGLSPPDSIDFVSFLNEQDSIMNYIDSVLKDTASDTLGLDALAGDSALIRDKLNFLFLPQNTVEGCFEFHLNTQFGRWAYNLVIDFADMFGLDLCDLIRKIVRLLTFIMIVFTTIKGYIRAFGGGGPGGG